MSGFDTAIVDGFGFISFPDKQYKHSDLKNIEHKLLPIRGSFYTLAVKIGGDYSGQIVGWVCVESLGYKDVADWKMVTGYKYLDD